MAEINKEVIKGNQQLGQVLDSILTDLTTIKTAINTLTAKLNEDGGVSDTDYATDVALTTTT